MLSTLILSTSNRDVSILTVAAHSASTFTTASFGPGPCFANKSLPQPKLANEPSQVRDEAATLLLLIAQGCEISFKRLIQTSRNRLFSIINRINRNDPQAEEILQDVCLKIWTCADRFSTSHINGNAWLNALARNAAIDSLRRNASRPAFDVASDNTDESAYDPIESPLDGPLQILMASRRRDYIDAAFELLPSEDSQVVKMSFFDDLSHQQIANCLGKPLGSIKTRIRRALLKMQLTTPIDA